jgi:hypothetical protein
MASDSRTNAGHDQVNVARKMHTFVQPGGRVFILLRSGSLSCTQSIITLLKRDLDQGKGLAQAPSLYDAARVIGEQVRRVSDMDRDALERDDFKFNVNLVLGGQVRGESPGPRSRPARTRRTCRSARPSTGGPSSTAAYASGEPPWKRRPSTRCCRSTRPCART